MSEKELYVLTLNEEQLREYFKKELDCPLPVREDERYAILKDEIIWLWKKICSTKERSYEAQYICYDDEERDFQLEEDGYDELKAFAINLCQWIDEAKVEFLDSVKPITSIMADNKIYKKHLPQKKMSLDELKRIAKNQDAGYFYDSIKIIDLDGILLQSMKHFFQEIINSEKIRYGVKCKEKMGVSNLGYETEFILIEINKSSSTSHAYPCEEVKAKGIKPLIRKVKDEIDYDVCFDDRNPESEIVIELYVEL